jgi:hypothetical protein
VRFTAEEAKGTYHATIDSLTAVARRRPPVAGALRPKQPLAAVASASPASASSAAATPQKSAGVRRYTQRRSLYPTKACASGMRSIDHDS